MNKQTPYILVVDDEQDIRQLVSEILEDEGYQVAMAENAAEAKKLKSQRQPNLILLDIWMPDSDGITLLREWVGEDSALCPVVMMSGHGSVESAVEATRLGAYDFLEKPLSMAKLLLIVERALETSSLQRENAGLKQQLMIGVEPVGKSAVVERTKDKLKRLAQHDARLLLVGEAGVGKEMYARYLHNNSSRRDGAFVDVSVGSISRKTPRSSFSAAKTTAAFTAACWSKPTAARYSWAKSAAWTRKPKPVCSARWNPVRSCVWAAAKPCGSTCAWSPPPGWRWRKKSTAAASARTCIIC